MTPEQKAQFDKVEEEYKRLYPYDGNIYEDWQKLKKMMGYYDKTSGLNPDGSFNWSGREKIFAENFARGEKK